MTEKEQMNGKCPKCGHVYESEEDLVECKYNGEIWYQCPNCNHQF